MQPFGEFAADRFIAARPQLSSCRASVVDAAALYLMRFDNSLAPDHVQDSFAAFSRRVGDAVGWSAEESRRVALRTFHDASKAYFAEGWDHVERYVEANANAIRAIRRRNANRMDIIRNGLGPNENAVRQVDDISLDLLIANATMDRPVVVKVYADYCSVCAGALGHTIYSNSACLHASNIHGRAGIAGDFEAVAREMYGRAVWLAVDGPRNLSAKKRFNVNSYPTILKFSSPDGDPDLLSRGFSRSSMCSFASLQAEALALPDEGACLHLDEDEDVGSHAVSSPPATPVDAALAISAEHDPDPAGATIGQWARMLRRQGIDELEALVRDRDAAVHSKIDDAMLCNDGTACRLPSENGEQHMGLDPVVILLGGGMGSGKSSSMAALSRTEFWVERGPSVVVVEADAFKHVDPALVAVNAVEAQNSAAARVLHPKSLEFAENLFLRATEARRDVVFDGTLSWKPFVDQTIAMLRDTDHHYVRGPGYQKAGDGTVSEVYWVKGRRRLVPTRPYRIEVVGVTIEPAVAVERGIVRKLVTGRGVPVSKQLESHKSFSENFEDYVDMVDAIYLFDMQSVSNTDGNLQSCNSDTRGIIAAKMGVLFPRAPQWPDLEGTTGLEIFSREAYDRFLAKRDIYVDATCSRDLYTVAAGLTL